MTRVPARTLASVVGVLVVVEFTSGVLQGWYTPMLTDIARSLDIRDADVNWFEGAQLLLAALVVPAFAKLGDMLGHKRMLLWSTALTALASLALPLAGSFVPFLVAWALQGFYVVWLPLQIALIWSRSRELPHRAAVTAAAAGLLVGALETGAITGALAGGALVGTLPLPVVLVIPALLVVVCFVVVLVGVRESPSPTGGRFDSGGLALVSSGLIGALGGLGLVRILGAASPVPWLLLAAGIALLAVFARWELRHEDPLIDVRMFRSPALGPVFLNAGLFGVSVLGAQAPLSTFARTDPSVNGYGLGTTGFTTSLIIGVYLIAMIVGALLFPPIARAVTPRRTLVGASLLVAAGFLLLIPLNGAYASVVGCMVVVGLGSGALVAALPAAAASAAPASQTGVATGLTNSVKTVGGAVASAVFGLALVQGAAEATVSPFAGYVTVWLVCGGTAVAAALLLLVVPKDAFTDRAARDVGPIR
ncbi:Major Facilitator Superfamily protein [Rathayibacter oskolensis]|uniref:Major Facilitator Superfamily protein n=1 Tax=Rathayibacter oskolensis TaxID=1891671 RepID=A0A1X7P8P5_9MICO|nr:MFS transporter [Rathayibacter oskolensis]SMH47216.1 Major Facilitator Superfamily protein [Rathayibacter oskolensis]